MITSLFTWLLKAGICSGVFYAYYYIALRHRRNFTFNRLYLGVTALLSALIPLLRIPLFTSSSRGVAFPLMQLTAPSGTKEEIVLNLNHTVGWQQFLIPAYVVVTAILLVRVLWQLLQLFRWKQKAHCVYNDEQLLLKTQHPDAPFSFMHLLFWPESLETDSCEARCMLRHEQAHIDQLHTLDKLLMQVLCAIAWMNPFFWLMAKQLELQHEYLADEAAITADDTDAFARMLLLAGFGMRGQHVSHHFTQSSVTRRLLMIRNTAGRKLRFMDRVVPVFLLLGALTLFAFAPASDVPRANTKLTVMLDAGHGGNDKGASAVDGLTEKELMLSLVREMTALADDYNIQVVSTRSSDESVPLDMRVQRAKTSGADLFLSLHMDKSQGAGRYELGVAPKNAHYPQSRVIASAVAERLQTELDIPVLLADEGNIRVLRDNTLPALLLSCGNIDDPAQCAVISDPQQRTRFCRTLLSGLVNYANRR